VRQVATIAGIVEQHVGDAAFLWFRRGREIDGHAFGATDVGRLDQRLDANLAGLVEAGEAGWAAACAAFADWKGAGEVFVLGTLALRSGEAEAIDTAAAAAADSGAAGARGLSGALARTPRELLRGHVPRWLASPEASMRRLALCAYSHHRVDPGDRLATVLADPDAAVRARALRLAGELGRRDLVPAVAASLAGGTQDERLRAAVALCLLGEARLALAALDAAVDAPELAAEAIEIRLLARPGPEARHWLHALIDRPATRMPATAAVGLLGDRGLVPWLIRRMRDPALAYAAGQAFRDLFEVDFADTDLFTDDPERLGPEFAEVEDHPLPVADRVKAWFEAGPREAEPFRSMRRRRLDAIRAAIAAPGSVLANWRRTRRFPAWM
jgi:uncharacterized protein (TIGR02270 family)